MKTIDKALFILEGIACLLIVIHHCNFPGALGFVLDTIARIGVSIFFMVSGYLNYKVLIIVLSLIKLIIDMVLIKVVIFNGYQTRNWLFTGLPFFLMGEYLKENENKIVNLKNKIIYIYLMIFTINLIAERGIFKVLFNTSLRVFTSTYFICYLLFIWCINNNKKAITMF